MQKPQEFFAWLASEPFIVATGAAAWVHSTWTFAISFSGALPPSTDKGAWLLTMIPAALLAFAIDVGQIRTANDIRKGQRNGAKLLTFGVLALATAYLQWFYMVAHIPALPLGAGIRSQWIEPITVMRDASVFIIPLLLPIATVLYTISNSDAPAMKNRKRKSKAWSLKFWQWWQADPLEVSQNGRSQSQVAIAKSQSLRIKAPQNGANAIAIAQNDAGLWIATCAPCDYATEPKDAERNAQNAINAHTRSGKHQELIGAMNESGQ